MPSSKGTKLAKRRFETEIEQNHFIERVELFGTVDKACEGWCDKRTLYTARRNDPAFGNLIDEARARFQVNLSMQMLAKMSPHFDSIVDQHFKKDKNGQFKKDKNGNLISTLKPSEYAQMISSISKLFPRNQNLIGMTNIHNHIHQQEKGFDLRKLTQEQIDTIDKWLTEA